MFVPNPKFGELIAAESEYRDGLAKAAEPARAKVAALAAPTRIMPRPGVEQIVIENDADGVRVVNTDFGAHLAEYGSANNPPYAPMRRGIREAGLRLEESPKS